MWILYPPYRYVWDVASYIETYVEYHLPSSGVYAPPLMSEMWERSGESTDLTFHAFVIGPSYHSVTHSHFENQSVASKKNLLRKICGYQKQHTINGQWPRLKVCTKTSARCIVSFKGSAEQIYIYAGICAAYIPRYTGLIHTHTTIHSVAILVKFWTPEIYPKFCRNFGRNFLKYFASSLNYFPAPKNISWEITWTIMLSNIFWNSNFYRIFFKCGKISERFNL